MDTPETAPAQSVPTETITPPPSPAQQAAKDNDFATYRAAKREERAPAKPAEAPKDSKEPQAPIAAAAVPAADSKPVSNRQAKINDYERTIAQLRADVDRLSAASLPKPPAPAPTVETRPTVDPEPDPSDATKYPDGQYDRKYLKDQARWEARDELRAHEAKQQETRDQELAARTRAEAEKTHSERTKGFVERVTASRTSDPESFDRIDPKLLQLTPSIARQPGEPLTFGHAVADVLLKSTQPVALMLHLSDPQEAARLASLSPDDFYREIGQIEAGITHRHAPVPPPAPRLSTAPPPVPTVGDRPASPSDPVKRAAADNNFPAFRAARAAERLAQHR